MHLKAILFDLGDTLLDFAPMDSRAVFEQAGRRTYQFLQARGHSLPPFQKYFRRQYSAVRWSYFWSKLRGREFNSFHLLGRMCHKMGLKLDDASLRQLAWEWYEPLTHYSSVHSEVIPTLRRFRDRGLKLGIVSNTFIPGFVLDRHMEMHGLLEFFPVRIYSSEIGYRKPHPRIFQAALDALGVDPKDAIFVGDMVRIDIVGAQRMGMVGILRKRDTETRTHAVADHAVREISEIYRLLPILGAPPALRPVPREPEREQLAYEGL
jgi:HAD superfamily hydrolase (TIGR01549 family)